MANDTIRGSLEELLNKSISAGKTFVSEGSRLVRDVASNGGKVSDSSARNALLNEAFSEYVRMNVRHMSNLMDLGLDFMRRMSGGDAGRTGPSAEQPGFTLEADAVAGQTVGMDFVLDNTKDEDVVCTLLHSDFRMHGDNSLAAFPITFQPQGFPLARGGSQKVTLLVEVPKDAKPGSYTARVQISGFEPAFFAAQVNVSEPEVKEKATSDGSKRAKK